jgi:hypothetical protein
MGDETLDPTRYVQALKVKVKVFVCSRLRVCVLGVGASAAVSIVLLRWLMPAHLPASQCPHGDQLADNAAHC